MTKFRLVFGVGGTLASTRVAFQSSTTHHAKKALILSGGIKIEAMCGSFLVKSQMNMLPPTPPTPPHHGPKMVQAGGLAWA